MVKYQIDVTQPFIAIRKDCEGSFFERTLGEYFCNPLSEALLDVRVEIGGFYSAGDSGVLESKPKEKPAFNVPSGKAVRYTISTLDEFNEMVVYWTVRYRTESGGSTSVDFGSFKAFEDMQEFADVPALGGRGLVVPRSSHAI